MTGLLLALLLAAPPAAAQDDLGGMGLDPVTRQLYQRAVDSEERGNWSAAASAWRLVLARDPGYPPAVLGLGRALEQSGDRSGAERAYSQLQMDADAVEALGLLIEAERPEEAAALYERLQSLRLGAPTPWLLEARALAATDALDDAAESLEQHLALAGDDAEDGRAGAVMVTLAEALRGAERPEDALTWLDDYLDRWPEGERAERAGKIRDRLQVERRAEGVYQGGDEPLDELERARLEEARRLQARGDLTGAREILDALEAIQPRAAELWAARADLALLDGSVAEAERAWLTAIALAPDEPSYRYGLAALLEEHYGGRRHDEAARELREALALRPGWVELHYRLGALHQARADFQSAEAELSAYLRKDPGGEHVTDARRRLEALRREPPPPPQIEDLASSRPTDVSAEAWDHYRVVRVYLERGDDEDARAELAELIRLAPEWVEVQNLQAALHLRAGRVDDAVLAYERSLNRSPSQPLVLMELGGILEARGATLQAARRYREAADAGAADAHFALARLAEVDGRWLDAREHLKDFFARSTGGPSWEQAISLRDELDQRWRVMVGSGALAGLMALGLPLGLTLYRRGGIDLRAFLERHPEHYPDVARVIGAMRHEVLKHNTTVLPTVADALEAGDRGPALDVADRLCGEVADRWDRYLGELVALSRRSGRRLEPRQDAVLAPMVAAFRDLRAIRKRLKRGDPRIAPRLREISEALNVQGYQALGQLSREICVLELDADAIQRCWQSVRAEPGFAGAALPDLEMWIDEPETCEAPMPVKIFRGDLEEILINLMRNALQVMLRDPGQGRLGVSIEEEVDFVTGLESVVIRVLDTGSARLTDAMLRGQDVDRGLGIVLDRVKRHDGAIKVEPGGDGWTKAIAVRLPRAEGEEWA